MSKCSYCGSSNYGSGCLYSPTGYHIHEDNSDDECIYCGRRDYGPSCLFSPIDGRNCRKIHVHGHGSRCIYCGKSGVHGPGCLFAEDGNHRF